jgi:hypothetical protein
MHSGLFGGGYDSNTVMLPVFQFKPAIVAQPPAPEPLDDPPELLLLELELLDPPELLAELELLDPELLDPELLDPELLEEDELALLPPLLLPPPLEELELVAGSPLDEPAGEPLLDEPEPPPPPSSPPALDPLSHGVDDESEVHPPPAAAAKNATPKETAIASLFMRSLSKLRTMGMTGPPSM